MNYEYEYSDQYKIDVLENMNECTPCTDIQGSSSKKTVVSRSVDWMIENLPGLDYATQRLLNYMFSNGLSTGEGEETDKRLEKWMYETKNKEGAANYSVLRSTLRDALLKGECGLRLYEGALYQYPKGKYGTLYTIKDGIHEVLGYYIRKNGEDVEEEINTKDWSSFNSYNDIMDWFDENDYLFLNNDEFENIRNDVSTLHGYSPLFRDKQRLNLIIAIYERLNYDIRFDGPGRIFLHTKDTFTNNENEVSTGAVLNNSPGAITDRYKEAKQEAKDIANFIKNSSSDTVGVISGAFDNNVIHLPRVTQAKEFLEWLESDTVIMAQVIGMSPTLLEVGKLHGNVSMEKVIDNAMVNTVVPLRETYAIQFSALIAKYLGVSKIFFDKYDMQQIEDENDIRAKVAGIIKDLSTSYRNSESEDVHKLIDEFADVLRTSIYDETNTLRGL